MATIERHAGAPYIDGETLAAADLETDIGNILTVCNGGLEGSNLSASAGITGTQLATTTILTANMAANSITQPKIADGACSTAVKTLDSSPDTPLTASYAVYATQSLTTAAAAGPVYISAWIELTGSTTFSSDTNAIALRIRRDASDTIAEATDGFELTSSQGLRSKILHLNGLDTEANNEIANSYTLEAHFTNAGGGTTTNNVISTQIIAIEFRR